MVNQGKPVDDVVLDIESKWFTAVYENDTPELATLSEADPEIIYAKEKVKEVVIGEEEERKGR